ncbi:integrin beta-1-binding protein 1 isoform X2 [Petaurus breviceps papuanus]|uniref:integrin beta-1-binding protein 1 isoform X2 n=1 Tax=Petaurus breviceps papuanus TaxID=3040969 RepID=UPI0036DA9BCD
MPAVEDTSAKNEIIPYLLLETSTIKIFTHNIKETNTNIYKAGQSNSNSDTCAEFRIKYVGAIEKLKLSDGKSLEGPLDLINYIDVAQQDGKLPFVPLEEEFIMGVSKYGIKVSTSDQYDVLHRHALYLIIRMVCYDDGLGAGKSLLALKTTDASYEEYSLWVYQCNSLEQAQAICKVLATAFDSVLTSEKS